MKNSPSVPGPAEGDPQPGPIKRLCRNPDGRISSGRVGSQSVAASPRNALFAPAAQRPRPTGRDMDLRTVDLDPLGNRLLAALPREDFASLRPLLATGPLTQGSVLADAGDEVDRVVFPFSGMISLVLVMKDGRAIETATVGRNGVFGGAAAFGLYRSRVRAIVQIEMTGGFIPAAQFRK